MSFSLHQTYEQEIEIALASSEIARTCYGTAAMIRSLSGPVILLRDHQVWKHMLWKENKSSNTENTATGCALYLSNRYVEARDAVGEQVIPASSANLSNVIIRFFLINPLTWRRRRLL